MTEHKKSLVINGGLSRGQLLFCLMSLLAMGITFILPEVAIEAMSMGMRLCVETVIPALFPFMVLSELMIASGASQLLGRVLGSPLSKLFDISREGSVALMMGVLCGFPVGSRSAIALYEHGRISRGELEHLLMFCNNPSSAFLISAVGLGMLGSRQAGILLYCVHIVTTIVIGLAGRAIFAKKKARHEPFFEEGDRIKRVGGVQAFTDAVGTAASSMLMICAFVIFFSAIVGYLRYFAERVQMPALLTALMFGFFEMTMGISRAAELSSPALLAIAAAISGWSGLSVAFQFVGICREHKISPRPYFLSKICSAILNFTLVSVFTVLWGDSIRLGESASVPSGATVSSPILWAIIMALFIGGCVIAKKSVDK